MLWLCALSPEYPIIACTFRLTEHYLSGPMSRFNSWLNELQPEMFVELSPELAEERKIVHGGWISVRSARGQITARAMVTRRIRPLSIEGRIIHQIGLPFHWSFAGESTGGNANDLTAPGGRSQREHARGQSVCLPGRAWRSRHQSIESNVLADNLANSRADSRYAEIGSTGRKVWT